MISGTLLISTIFVLLLVVRGRMIGGFIPFPTSTEKKMARSLYILWRFLIHLPLIVIIVAVVFPEIVYDTLINTSFQGDTFVQITGLCLYVSGGILFYFWAKHMGRYFVPESVVAEDHELITTGPYSKIHHPAYTLYILLNLEITLFSLNLVLVICFLGALATKIHKAKLEEDLLSSDEGLGKQYRDYMNRTGRFSPRFTKP
jgi:protein-S-isoprenylcysteine O-methyltransferase Ste14